MSKRIECVSSIKRQLDKFSNLAHLSIGSCGNQRAEGLLTFGQIVQDIDIPHSSQTSDLVQLRPKGFFAFQRAFQAVALSFADPKAILHWPQLIRVTAFSTRSNGRRPNSGFGAIRVRRSNELKVVVADRLAVGRCVSVFPTDIHRLVAMQGARTLQGAVNRGRNKRTSLQTGGLVGDAPIALRA